MAAPEPRGILEALDEPALLLERSGAVRHANGAALRLFGCKADGLVGRRLAELSDDPPEALATLLRRFSGSSQAYVGSVQLRVAGGGDARRFRCRGSRVAAGTGTGEPLLLLRLEEAAHDRFKVLTGKVVALNAEIRRGKRTQFQLEVSLEQREMLLRELHHRVKNNLQTLLGILSIAERGAAMPEARDAIRDARTRVEAMAVLQRLLYGQEDLAGVDAAAFLAELCSTVERAFSRPGVAVRVVSAPVRVGLDVASALGLIANELLTNAFKHAFGDGGRGEITVRLSREGGPEGALVLVVEDDGRGLGPGLPSGTGLALVRGLARQQGGACAIEPAAPGVRCVVTLHDQQKARPRPSAN